MSCGVAAALDFLRQLSGHHVRMGAKRVDERRLAGTGGARDDRCFPKEDVF